MSEGLDKLFSFFRRRERFLVLEILSHCIKASLIKANFNRKRFDIVKALTADHDAEAGGAGLETVKRLLKRFGRLRSSKIILSLDSALTTTVHSAVVLMRDNPKEPVDNSDLDNRIAQGIWKLYDRERAGAAAKMNVRDLDVLLSDVKVKLIKLDGHQVVNPIGFKAKTIEIQFTQTFSARHFAEAIKELFPKNQPVLAAEDGVLAADIIARSEAPGNFLLVSLMPKKSSVFFSNSTDIAHIESFLWGKENLIQVIAGAFAVSDETAEGLFKIYLTHQASPAVLKKMESLVFEEFRQLTGYLGKAAAKFSPDALYLLPYFDLPEFVFGNKFRDELPWRAKIMPVSSQLITEKLGFSIRFKKPSDHESVFSPLAAILSFYFLPHDDKINKIAKRHARWLIS